MEGSGCADHHDFRGPKTVSTTPSTPSSPSHNPSKESNAVNNAMAGGACLDTSPASDKESSCELSEEASEAAPLQVTGSVHGLKRLRSVSFFVGVENESTGQSPTKRFSLQGLEVQGLGAQGLEDEVGSPGSWVTETGFAGLEVLDDELAAASPRSLGAFEGFKGQGFEAFEGQERVQGLKVWNPVEGLKGLRDIRGLESPGAEMVLESSALSCEFDLAGNGEGGKVGGRDVSSEVVSAQPNGHLDGHVLSGGVGTSVELLSESSGRESLSLHTRAVCFSSIGDDEHGGYLDSTASGDVDTAGEEFSSDPRDVDIGSWEHRENLGSDEGSGFEELETLTGGDAEQALRIERIEALLAQEVLAEAEMIEARIALESSSARLGLESVPHVDIATWLQGLRQGAHAIMGAPRAGLGVEGLAEDVDFSEVGSSIGNTSMAVLRGDLNSHLGSTLGEDDEGSEGLESRVMEGLEGEGMGPIPENVGGNMELVGFELAPTVAIEEAAAGDWAPDRVWMRSSGLATGLEGGLGVVTDGVRLRRRTREEEELPLLAHLSPRSEGGVSSIVDSYPHLHYMDQLEEATTSEQLGEILTGQWNPGQDLRVLGDMEVVGALTEVDANLTELEWASFLREALLGAWQQEQQSLQEGLAQGLGAGLETRQVAADDETLRRFSLLNPGEMVAALADPHLVARLETRAGRGLFIEGTRVPILRGPFAHGVGFHEVGEVLVSDDDDIVSEAEESEVALDDVIEEGDDVIDDLTVDLESYGAFCAAGAGDGPSPAELSLQGGASGWQGGPPAAASASAGGGIVGQSDPPQDCSICYRPLEAEPVLALKCGHEYHGTCVKKWLKSGAPNALSCPFCRGKIRRTPALEELLPANGSPGRLRRSPSESTIDLHDERGIDRNDLLHEVRQWPDAERLIVSGIGIETVLQVLNEAQAEIRIIELYGTGEDRFAEEERFWYRMRGDAFPPLPSEAFHTGPALQTPDRHPVRGCAAVQRLLLHNGEMRSGSADNPLQLIGNPTEASFTAFLRGVFEQLPNLVDFSAPACGPELRPAGLAWLVRCCPKLRLLRLGWCSSPDLGLGVVALAEALGPQLEELEILGPLLGLDSLDALVLRCRRLRVLNITRSHHGGRGWPPADGAEDDENIEHTDIYDEAFDRLAELNPLLRIEVTQGSPDYVSF